MAENIFDFYPTRQNSTCQILQRVDPVVHSDNNGRLDKKHLEFFNTNGYLFFQNLFSKKEVESLYDEISKISDDSSIVGDPRIILEETNNDVRSIFEIHKLSKVFDRLSRDKRIADVTKQILDSDVYIHQSRVNLKPEFEGKEFFWHSDFETWHSEDGMPKMRAISCSISLTDNNEFNGPLMVMPGSHKVFISCGGQTPDNHYKQSLRRQEIGTPDTKLLSEISKTKGVVAPKGPAGSVVFFDCNIMHGSAGNISPYPRSNVFFVFNSTENKLIEPFCGLKPRPEYIASRDFTPLSILESFSGDNN